jgi:hypothetical protein
MYYIRVFILNTINILKINEVLLQNINKRNGFGSKNASVPADIISS